MLNQKKTSFSNEIPLANEGKDNEMRVVAYRGSLYLYYKFNGSWFRTKMEKL